MHNEGIDYYFHNSTDLTRNFQMLIDRNFKLLKGKNGTELSTVDLHINMFNHYLTIHKMKISVSYPLYDNYKRIRSIDPSLDLDTIKALINVIDLDSKSSFVTMCGFQIEIILKKISEANKITFVNHSMRTRFNNILNHFDIQIDDKLDLIDVFYWTRNTLHNGAQVDKSGTCTYAGFDYVFEIGKPIIHAHWNYLTYFVSEIIGIFELILNSKKYVESFEK